MMLCIKKIEDIKKIFAIILVVAISSNALAQAEEDPETAAARALFESSKSSGASSIAGGACVKYIEKKNMTRGQNFKPNGDAYFISIGTNEIKAPIKSISYAVSAMNASILAQLDAKKALVESMGTEMASDILSTTIQKFSEGKKPEFIGMADKPAKEIPNYEDMSTYQKTQVYVNQQLDKYIDPETKDAINSGAMSARDAEDKIKEIINQSSFKDAIKTKASGSVRGMKTIYSNFSVNKGANQTIVCSVGVWSDKLAAQTDAMVTGDYSKLKNLKKGKPLRDVVPSAESFEGFSNLVGTFGTFMVRDEKGQMTVLSYAQEGIKTNSAASARIAFENAKTRARRGIIQLREENITIAGSIEKEESTSESADGMIDYYSKEKSESRLQATASGTLKGDYEFKRWQNIHPQSGYPVAGIVMAWTPSGAEQMDKAAQTLSKSPKQESGNKPPVGYSPSDSDYNSGSSAGDDEEDF